MRGSLLSAVFLPLALFISGCQLVYTLPTRQGNVIEQKKLEQLQVGMTREQVRYLLGTPLAASPFDADRWDYLGYYRSPRGTEVDRTVTLYFEQDTLVRMEGIEMADAKAAIETPDLQTVVEEEERALLEAERKESEARGVIIRQEEDAGQPGNPGP